MEAIIAELLAALGAEEMLGVPGLVERCYAFLGREKRSGSFALAAQIFN